MSSRQINKLTSNSNFSSRKVLNSSHKSFNDLGKEPNQRKDLFRAYLDVRQHSTPFEEDKVDFLQPIKYFFCIIYNFKFLSGKLFVNSQ